MRRARPSSPSCRCRCRARHLGRASRRRSSRAPSLPARRSPRPNTASSTSIGTGSLRRRESIRAISRCASPARSRRRSRASIAFSWNVAAATRRRSSSAIRSAIGGAAPVTVNELCSARDAAGSANAVEVRFEDTNPRPFVIEYAHRHKTPGSAPALTFVWKTPDGALQREAVRTAQQADVIVAFVGLNAWLEGEEMDVKVPGFAGGDRTDIALPRPQAELVEALESNGQAGRGRSPERLGGRARPGKVRQCGPRRLVRRRAGRPGDRRRSERLVQSSRAAAGDFLHVGRRAAAVHRLCDEGPHLPLFHRQAGISVRLWSQLHALPLFGRRRYRARARTGSSRCASSNSGRRGGDEVVQLYVTPPPGGGVPLRSLKGFARITLAPGETRTVSFRLTPRDLAFADSKGDDAHTQGRLQSLGRRRAAGHRQPRGHGAAQARHKRGGRSVELRASAFAGARSCARGAAFQHR